MVDDNDTDQITEQLENSGAIGRVSDEAEDEDTIVTIKNLQRNEPN